MSSPEKIELEAFQFLSVAEIADRSGVSHTMARRLIHVRDIVPDGILIMGRKSPAVACFELQRANEIISALRTAKRPRISNLETFSPSPSLKQIFEAY